MRSKSVSVSFLIQVTVVVLVFCVLIPSDGRTVVKRNPQLSLTVIDEPETPPREHPPSPEDLEERRQALVKALVPGGGDGGGGGGGAAAAQLMTLRELAQDFLGGSFNNTGEIFAPLRNATQKARENFPRLGDVINRVVDSSREYRKNAAGVVRKAASSKFSNFARVATTATARGTEVLGGVFRLLRSLLNNLTLGIQSMAKSVANGLQRFSQTSSQFLSRNFMRIRNLLNNRMLSQPVRDASMLTGDLVRGVAEDLSSLQPSFTEGLTNKITSAARLIPRPNVAKILSPLADPEHKPNSDGVDIRVNPDAESEGGYSKKRDSNEDKDSAEAESMDELPQDVLELLASSDSESKVPKDHTKRGSNKITDSNNKQVKKPQKKTSKTKNSPSSSTTSKPEEGSVPTTTKTMSSEESETEAMSLEDLFGLPNNASRSN